MSEENQKAQEGLANGKSNETVVPRLNVLAQYVKDLSIENPNAPASLRPSENQPQINIQVNVNANPLNETEFEVDLSIHAKAENNDAIMFNIELMYSGIFKIEGVAKENIHPVVLIECPRLIFPFARQIIADSSQRAGFPPLMIDPFDFAELYRQKLNEIQKENQSKAGN